MGAADGLLTLGVTTNAVIGRPFVVDSAITYIHSGSSVNAAIPTGVIAGDIILYVAAHIGQVNLPTGHTMLNLTPNSTVMTGTNINGRTFFKVAAGTEGGTTQAVTFTATNSGQVVVVVIRGGFVRGYAQQRLSSTSAGATVTTSIPAATASAARDELALHVALTRATGATIRSNNGTLVRSQTDTAFAASIYQNTVTGTSQGGSWSPSVVTSGVYAITMTLRPIASVAAVSSSGIDYRPVSIAQYNAIGTTAGLLVEPGAGTVSLGSDLIASGVTASYNLTAGAGSVSMASTGLQAAGATATFSVSAGSGVGSIGGGSNVPGDYFVSPISLNGLSGSLNVDLLNSSVETGEPDAANFLHSVWLEIRPDAPGTLTVTSGDQGSFNHTIELFDGETFSELTLLASDNWISGTSTDAAEIAYGIGEIGPYYVRIRPYNVAAGGDASVSITWSLTTRTLVLIQEIITPTLDSTPASILVSCVNCDPNESVRFTLVGTGVVHTQVADASGIIQSTNVAIPELTAGTYTLQALGLTSGRSDSDSFQVLNSPIPRPTPPPADQPPTTVPQVGVRKWVLQDPLGVVAQYTFPFNPVEMKPIFAPRYVEVQHTTSPQGIPILWEGVARAYEWEFSGYLETQAFMQALVDYYNVNRRFFLIDHRNRAWVVTFEELDLQPRRNIEQPYAHDYTVKALIFGEAIQL